MLHLSISYPVRPRTRSLASCRIADLFGLSGDEPPHVVADGVDLDVRPGDVVLFVGPSGSGKSSLLRAAAAQLGALDAQTLELPDEPVIDALPGSVEERLELLSVCGLSEARLLLRTPGELSDGQRARFRLAFALAKTTGTSPVARQSAEKTTGTSPVARWILADEFAAVLDRTLAKVLAFNVRKLATRTGAGFLLATTHDDIADDLNPDLLVRCLGDGAIEVERRDGKKKAPASRTSSGCRMVPDATGRTSLGGITAATGSAS